MWNQNNVVEATGAKTFGSWKASRVCIDTRAIEANDLFVAFKGANVDGHHYVAEAFKRGASASMVEYIPEKVDCSKLILVKNCQKGLEDLAIYNRKRLHAKIIAVTGSVGKTSTKESLFLAFSALGATYTSQGNYNNHLGLPISLASIPISTKYAILEMGISNVGEMSYLTNLTRPDVVIITNITGVHLANFNSEEEIAKSKSEVFVGLNKNGVAILNIESNFFSTQVNEAKKYGVGNIITFGKEGDSFLISNKVLDQGIAVKAQIIGIKLDYHLSSYGLHHVHNSLAVLSAVQFLGGDLKVAAKALMAFKNIKGRGEVSEVIICNKRITLIDDSYNASPMSLRAALSTMHASFPTKRCVVILGDMRELGHNEIAEHKNIAQDIIENKIHKVIAIGRLMRYLYDELPESICLEYYIDVNESFASILALLSDGDVVLVKGSNGTKVYKLIDYFKEQG